MKKYKKLVLVMSLMGSSVLLAADTSINRIHSCLALTGFVYTKVSSANETYSTEEIALIRKGLKSYGQYLDRDVIDPKLLKLYGGNASQANLMKKLFSRQQSSFTRHLTERYAESKFRTDYAMAIEECSVKTGSQSDVALALKKAIRVMVKS